MAGLLQPLSIPGHPWSNIALDFVTGLPPSKGNTVILTIIDRFSIVCYFVALPKLPFVLEIASLLIDQIFQLHGIPAEMVSHRGPQFTSLVWKGFVNALGTSVSLSSGSHPQSNGQTERTNQDLESALHCVAATNPSLWSQNPPWVESAQNTLTCLATGLSPFGCTTQG